MRFQREDKLVVFGLLVLIFIASGAVYHMVDTVKGYATQINESSEQIKEPLQDQVPGIGEIFEENGMFCAYFVARDYQKRKELGVTCLKGGGFITIAPGSIPVCTGPPHWYHWKQLTLWVYPRVYGATRGG
jgi:hypothetical protein